MGKIRSGIGGWNFDPWRGPFYPPEVKKKGDLEAIYADGRPLATP